jgi:hypothetical protein
MARRNAPSTEIRRSTQNPKLQTRTLSDSMLTARMPSLSKLHAAFAALALLAVAGCSQAGRTRTAKLVSARETTRAWISEGSLARFSDTERLPGSKPGLRQDYEGWVDPHVAIRYASVAPGDAGYASEAEWTVEFKEPIARLAAAGKLDGSAKVRLRGMIQSKELRAFSRPGRAPFSPASIGNNVLTDDGTPWMTLSELDQFGDRFQLVVRMRSRTGKEFVHHSAWRDVAPGKKRRPSDTVLAIAGGFAHLCETRYPEWRNIRLLNLSAQGRHSGFMQERGRYLKAAAGSLVHPFETAEGLLRGGAAPARLRTRMSRQISAHDAGLFGRISMELLDAGTITGRATLNLVSQYSGS